MSAIITDVLKKQLAQSIFDDIQDSDGARYYIGVGRGDGSEWGDSDIPVDPVNSEREARNFRLNLQSVKRVADFTFAVRRFNWTYGETYSAYNDNIGGLPDNSSYYVLTEDNGVYICLRQARDADGIPTPSFDKPEGTDPTPQSYPDGYVWKFLYTIGTLDASKYLTANFMPIKLQGATDSDSLAVEIEQETIQNSAIPGQIVGIEVVNGGAGYTSQPTVNIVGNGTGARALATIASGVVTRIQMDESDGSVLLGQGYDYAEAVITGGGSPSSTATARVILGPKNGFGADPRTDLRSSSVMFNIKPEGQEENDTWLVDNSFRQVGIIRNPKVPNSDSDFIEISGNCLKKLPLAGTGGPGLSFTVGSTITGGSSQAQGIIDKRDSDEIWYHQNDQTGFTQFIEGEAVTDDDGGSATLQASGVDGDSDAFVEPDVNIFSGDILYIENRAKIDRFTDQTEDIKLIIQI